MSAAITDRMPLSAADLARAVLEHDSWSPSVVRMLAEETIRLSAALEWIASQEQYTFAECSLAEEIIGRAKDAVSAGSPCQGRP